MRSFLIEKENQKNRLQQKSDECGHDHDDHHEHHDHHVHGDGCGHEHGEQSPKLLVTALVLFGFGILVNKTGFSAGVFSNELIKGLLYLAAYILAGYQTVLLAFKNMFKGEFFDESFLMTLATFGAIGIREYPEAAAVMLFYQVGEYFQSKAVARSRRSISELMDIRPDFANLILEDGSLRQVHPEDLSIGDFIAIKSGEKIPVDSTIVEGSTTVDSKALTGESIPVEMNKGDLLMSGTINLTGLVKARVDKSFGESTVSKILELVQNASSKKSNQERFITRFSKYYTPVVVLLAIFITIVPVLFFGEPFAKWFSRALIFLVISCPCALVISVPLSFFAGIGGASKKGILFKGSGYVEQLSQVDTMLMDKTGTLTKGHFEVASIVATDRESEPELLRLAAYAEQSSNHPIGKSIVKEYERRTGMPLANGMVEKVDEISGFGVKALIEGKYVLAGNRRLMEENQVPIQVQHNGETTVYVAQDGRLLGVIIVEDKIKDDSKKAIDELNKRSVRTVILTGDSRPIAEKVGTELGVSAVYSELLPQDKVKKVEEELSEAHRVHKGKKVAFVGDGINDAPVLARADLGIAMGGIGSDAAIEAADVVLMTDEPSKIAEAIDISKKTMSVAKQNIAFALGVKFVVMALGIVGIANMWLAVFADVGVSILAIFNAMRAYRVKTEP